jgi:hypothetical protein
MYKLDKFAIKRLTIRRRDEETQCSLLLFDAACGKHQTIGEAEGWMSALSHEKKLIRRHKLFCFCAPISPCLKIVAASSGLVKRNSTIIILWITHLLRPF